MSIIEFEAPKPPTFWQRSSERVFEWFPVVAALGAAATMAYLSNKGTLRLDDHGQWTTSTNVAPDTTSETVFEGWVGALGGGGAGIVALGIAWGVKEGVKRSVAGAKNLITG